MASAGSFAAISTLLGSPVLGAFLIMEVAGIGGAALSLVALPGLLASGIGALVFVGLDKWTGLGTFSLALPSVPPGVPPTLATMGWALSAFRGGPVFPSMFIGTAVGIAASGLPGMDLAPAIGMGIGAMCAAMLRLPLTSTLLAVLLMGADGTLVTPQVVVAVVVAFVITNVLPAPGPKTPEPA
jgi:Voltage gated chloride channel